MKLDLLIAEIGSTTTLVNGFNLNDCAEPVLIGQGLAPTSVLAGDVMIGLTAAIDDLKGRLKLAKLEWGEFMATSSAAGGLKMSVHGLVKDMTVKAAREAALGAGAVVKMVTAGRLRDAQLKEILALQPNIILLAGGVDDGEEEIILANAEKLSRLQWDVPLIYAGNSALQREITDIFKESGQEILVSANVYPRIDQLNVRPTRKLIHEVFARHIIHAPGMEKIEQMLSDQMMPTPGAVMEASQLLKDELGNLVVIDVGGATTDVHSITEDSPGIKPLLLNPEPAAKRTVEGDLGVYVNARHVWQLLQEELALDEIREISPLPRDQQEESYVEILAEKAALTAVKRHAGELRDYYGPTGRQTIAEGKDLTAVKWIIGTGGALTRLQRGREILQGLKGPGSRLLLPPLEAKVLIDRDYIMASAGLMSKKYPEAALSLMKKSLAVEQGQALPVI